MAIHPIFIQASYYGIVFFLALLIISILERGFFWKFLKVRLSFGRLILVKIKSKIRDHYSIGEIQDNWLVFKVHKEQRRINVKKSDIFYRSIGVTWVDMDEETNALFKPNYKGVEGYDAVKFQHLYTRALYRPTIASNKDKLIIGLMILTVLGLLIIGYMVYKNTQAIELLKASVAALDKGVVVGKGGVI